MREVSVDRFVPVPPREIERALSPADVVEYEGSFRVLDVEERDDATIVTAGASAIGAEFQFERRDDALYYEQAGDAGPFDELWTELGWEPKNEGSRVLARSGVSLGLPLSGLTDRVAAWKRRGELDRALEALADDLS